MLAQSVCCRDRDRAAERRRCRPRCDQRLLDRIEFAFGHRRVEHEVLEAVQLLLRQPALDRMEQRRAAKAVADHVDRTLGVLLAQHRHHLRQPTLTNGYRRVLPVPYAP
ncbi:hypothetical protein G6F61_014618 [Rhizopus arrhizus]|nr:hypothetical protein G6F61_014618 [Rhizopus arrhizus]